MSETRFLYTVNPRKIIKQIGKQKLDIPIKGSKSVRLTKEEVLECLQYGAVYRRFVNQGIGMIRVTKSNIDKVHVERYEEDHVDTDVCEDAAEELEVESAEEEQVVQTTEPEEVVEENDDVEEPAVEETEADEVCEEDTNESVPEEEIVVETEKEEVAEPAEPKTVVAEAIQSQPQKHQQKNNVNYHNSGKNKHNKH